MSVTKLRIAYEANKKEYIVQKKVVGNIFVLFFFLKKIMLDPHFTTPQNTSQIYLIIKWKNKSITFLIKSMLHLSNVILYSLKNYIYLEYLKTIY